jgi:hypothetical protein
MCFCHACNVRLGKCFKISTTTVVQFTNITTKKDHLARYKQMLSAGSDMISIF